MTVSGLAGSSEAAYVQLSPPDFSYSVPVLNGASPTLSMIAPPPFAILPFTLGEMHASRVYDFTVGKGVKVSGKVRVSAGQPALTEGACPLTARELDVLRHALRGGTVATIAREAHLAAGTVRNYLSSAMTKLGVHTRYEAARLAWDEGWI